MGAGFHGRGLWTRAGAFGTPVPMPQRLALPSCFVLFALPVLLFLAVAVPTGEVPDEVAHIVRMDGLLHGAVLGHRVPRPDHGGDAPPDSGVTASTVLLAAGYSFTPGTPLRQRVMTRDRLQALQDLPWGDQVGFVSIPNTGAYAPLFYIPGALAMGNARVLGAGPWQAIVMARVVNAILYVILGVLALLLARRAQGLVFAALVLPMSLWLAASCNQDGLVIATAALAAALLTRGSTAGWWGGAFALAAVLLAKPPYLPLAGIVAVLLPRRGGALPLRVAGVMVAAAPALLWLAVAQSLAAVPFVRGGPFHPGPNWFGAPDQVFSFIDPGMQLQVLLNRPSLLLTLPYDSVLADPWLLRGAVGVLGVLDVVLPAWLYALWAVALAVLCLGEGLVVRREWPYGTYGTLTATPSGPLAAVLVLLCLLATFLALFAGQYLSWTYTGSAVVEGMQGRYFIPLIPFAGLALPRLRVGLADVLRTAFRVPAVAAAAAGLAVVPALVVTTYYLR